MARTFKTPSTTTSFSTIQPQSWRRYAAMDPNTTFHLHVARFNTFGQEEWPPPSNLSVYAGHLTVLVRGMVGPLRVKPHAAKRMG